MNRRQQVIASIVYFFFGIIIFTIFLSFIFQLFNAPASNPFFGFWYAVGGFFAGPFEGIYPDFILGPFTFSTYTFIAMIFYSLFAYNIALFISSFAELNPFRILRNIIRFIFRTVESILFTRFIFMALAASTASSYVRFIYGLTDPVIAPIASVVPSLTLGIFVIEFSTFLLLGIIIFFDILFENLFAGFLGEDSK